jgi:PiT family inorganic phosphate transporter
VSGFNDGGSLLASFTAGRLFPPRVAAAILLLVMLGPILVGTKVATTVSASIVDLPAQGPAGFVAIIAVSLVVVLGSWRLGLPTSMTLALIGAMVGWSVGDPGSAPIHWLGVARVLFAMPASVLGGAVAALLTYRLAQRFLSTSPQRRMSRLGRSRYITSSLQAVAYGANDMAKTIGLVAAAELIGGYGHATRQMALLPIIVAFLSFASGALAGGWSVARRVSTGLFAIRPAQALSEQFGAGVVVATLAWAGAPVSSTQTISGSLVGIGVGTRASAVRWSLIRSILASWVATLPLAFLGACAVHVFCRFVIGIE